MRRFLALDYLDNFPNFSRGSPCPPLYLFAHISVGLVGKEKSGTRGNVNENENDNAPTRASVNMAHSVRAFRAPSFWNTSSFRGLWYIRGVLLIRTT